LGGQQCSGRADIFQRQDPAEAMFHDDLTAPLGQDEIREQPSRGKAIALAAVLGTAGLIAVSPSPLGERIGPPASAVTQSADISRPAGTAVQGPRPTTDLGKNLLLSYSKEENGAGRPLHVPVAGELADYVTTGTIVIEKESGVKIVRAGGADAPGPLVIDVAKALSADTTAAADPRIIEQSRYGPLPRVGIDGARPSKIYARPVFSSGGAPHSPRIALVVGGMGLSERATESAIATLPGEVTLAFAPYGSGLARQTALARQAGHEIILQIPMEPFGSLRGDPGPHALLAGAEKAANIDNLTWLMSRFTGYAGVVNFLGGRFTADEKALSPVLREIAKRGLFFLDDGSSSQTIAVTLAADQGLPAARADVVLDSTGQPEAIEAALARLEETARDKGAAIGVASALPSSIVAIERFPRALESRGVSLIPLSAAIPSQKGGLADSSPER
jgi:uncharacterized protein